MARGQKICKSCGTITGPRSFVCPKCKTPFEFKINLVKQDKVEKSIDWQLLQRGDRIKILKGSGPYWPANLENEDSEDIPMGYYGKFVVKWIDKNGIHADSKHGHCYIWMGESGLAQTGIFRQAHKIVKFKKRVSL